jgi:hypothetical protein
VLFAGPVLLIYPQGPVPFKSCQRLPTKPRRSWCSREARTGSCQNRMLPSLAYENSPGSWL